MGALKQLLWVQLLAVEIKSVTECSLVNHQGKVRKMRPASEKGRLNVSLMASLNAMMVLVMEAVMRLLTTCLMIAMTNGSTDIKRDDEKEYMN